MKTVAMFLFASVMELLHAKDKALALMFIWHELFNTHEWISIGGQFSVCRYCHYLYEE